MQHIKDTLSKYAKSDTLRLHMPGHKGTLNTLDNTEIPQTDDFNTPQGPYKKTLELLSDTYSSNISFFLTTGATTGIQAMVLYAKLAGYKIIAMRNAHMSVINACCMFNSDFEILKPFYDEKINTYVSADDIFCTAIQNTNERCALIVTSPDYYGRCVDMKKIHEAAMKKDVLIFCDEAHGAHFTFSDDLPASCEKYSDIWVHGAHKTLGALTQGAYLHCAKTIDAPKMKYIMSSQNTSSPSHLIAMTLENAFLEAKGDRWDKRALQCLKLQEKINNLKYLKCADINWAQNANYMDKDACRIVIDAKNAGGGFSLYKKLFEEHNIQLEMADFRYATAIMTIYDTDDCDSRFFRALKLLDIEDKIKKIPHIPKAGECKTNLKDAWLNISEYAALKDCIGRVSAVALGAYPPGCALVLQGEVITSQHIKYFEDIISAGGSTFGIYENMIAVTDI